MKGCKTMLRTNSKKAKENIKNYILENFNPEGYIEEEKDTITKNFSIVCNFIYTTFYHEEVKYNKNKLTNYEMFKWWCQGLPSVLDCCYYYNRSAIEEVAKILEETEEEKNRFTEQQAEELLTKLIYKTIVDNL